MSLPGSVFLSAIDWKTPLETLLLMNILSKQFSISPDLLEILPEGWEIREDLGGTEKESAAPTGTTEGLDKATVKRGCGWRREYPFDNGDS